MLLSNTRSLHRPIYSPPFPLPFSLHTTQQKSSTLLLRFFVIPKGVKKNDCDIIQEEDKAEETAGVLNLHQVHANTYEPAHSGCIIQPSLRLLLFT